MEVITAVKIPDSKQDSALNKKNTQNEKNKQAQLDKHN